MPVMIYASQFMSTALPCVPSNILDFPVVGMGSGEGGGGIRHLYSAVFVGALDKQGLILIVHLKLATLSFKWIHLTSTSWQIVLPAAPSYSCCTMALPQSIFSWMDKYGPPAPRHECHAHNHKGPARFLSFKETKSAILTNPWHPSCCWGSSRGLKALLFRPYWSAVILWRWNVLFLQPASCPKKKKKKKKRPLHPSDSQLAAKKPLWLC